MDSSVEDFFERIKELDRERVQNDNTSKKPKKKPPPQRCLQQRASMIHSESINDFNSSVSKEYRVNVDDLEHESAYNYDKSQKKGNIVEDEENRPQLPTRPRAYDDKEMMRHSMPSSGPMEDGENDRGDEPRPMLPTRPNQPSHKKHEDLEIIRFDDFVTKKPYKPRSQPPIQPVSRYSKFELSEEEKRKLDGVINGLIGGSGKEDDESSQSEEEKPALPVRRSSVNDRSEGSASPMKRSPSKMNISKDTDEETRPSVPTRKPDFHPDGAPKENPKMKQGVKQGKKPEVKPRVNVESDLKTHKEDAKPQVKARPEKPTWLGAAFEHSNSTFSQGISTTPNYSIDCSGPQNKWLHSAAGNSSSTTQATDTTSNVSIASTSGPSSWLDSAKKTLSASGYSPQGSKIAPIVPSKSNTLAKTLKEDEQSKYQREKTLKELYSSKLNHIGNASPQKPKAKPDVITPITLKKVRPAAPPPRASHSKSPELVSAKLKPAIPARKPSLEIPEVLNASKSLKPAPSQRKVSTKIPEAIAKKDKLKNPGALPEQPIVVLEAISKKRALREVKPLPIREDDVPEALTKSQRLKPSIPMRKPSAQQLEALKALNTLKKGVPPEVKPKPRVLSQSREMLNQKVKDLKSVKEEVKVKKEDDKEDIDPRRAILERVLLHRARSTTPIPSAAIEEQTVPIKKASTFDSSLLQGEDSLNHLTKTRSKGPKRRAPKGK